VSQTEIGQLAFVLLLRFKFFNRVLRFSSETSQNFYFLLIVVVIAYPNKTGCAQHLSESCIPIQFFSHSPGCDSVVDNCIVSLFARASPRGCIIPSAGQIPSSDSVLFRCHKMKIDNGENFHSARECLIQQELWFLVELSEKREIFSPRPRCLRPHTYSHPLPQHRIWRSVSNLRALFIVFRMSILENTNDLLLVR
jgi:hypothetical protein